jgi:pyocin large subunit-like protein
MRWRSCAGPKPSIIENSFVVMSIKALNFAFNCGIQNSGAKFVLIALANYADENNLAYPSRETLAAKTAFSVRAVQNHLNWLVENGYIITNRRKNGIHQILTNVYEINLEAEKKPDRKDPENKTGADSALGQETQKPSADFDKSLVQISTKPSADFDKSLVQISTKPSADFDKKPSADSAHNTKALKGLNQSNTTKGSEPHAPAPAQENFRGEIFDEPTTAELEFFEKCLNGLKVRFKTPIRLKNETEWLEPIGFWWENEATAENLLEIFDVKNEIRVRKHETWQMTPRILESCFGTLEALKIELERVKNGVEKNAKSNGNFNRKRTPAEVILSRDFSRYDAPFDKNG